MFNSLKENDLAQEDDTFISFFFISSSSDLSMELLIDPDLYQHKLSQQIMSLFEDVLEILELYINNDS